MKRRYSRRTLDALIRHIAAGGSTETYLRAHPRVTHGQIAAIFQDLRDAVDRRRTERPTCRSDATEELFRE